MSGLLRHLWLRPVTYRSLAGGAVCAVLLLLAGQPWLHAMLLGWCVNVVSHAALLLRHMLRLDPETMRQRAMQLAEGRRTVLLLSVGAAVASLVAVVWDFATTARGAGSPAIAVATILLSWVYVHLLFAQEYAHEYYLLGGGLDFHRGSEPGFIDFLYLSFTIGMTCQVSDTETQATVIRQMILLHGLIAFCFNTVIVAAMVNIAAGLAQ